MVKPAIVTVGYNRPESMKRLLTSIQNATFKYTDIPLIISIDESELSDEVEKVAKEFYWKYGTKEIRRFPNRQGLRRHIIQCGDYSEKYGAVIILEDDLVVAEDFYSYVCTAHEFYSDNALICGVSLYSYHSNVFTRFTFSPTPSMYDVYLGDMIVTWGQSWTSHQWLRFKQWYIENEDKLESVNTSIPRDISRWTRSWGRYYAYYMAKYHLSYIFPYVARSTCFSDFGEHNKTLIPLTFVQVPLMVGNPENYRFGLYEKLVHYDSFYERVLNDGHCIAGIPGNEICLDINNMKTCSEDKNYVITNSKLPHERIKSFGLTLKPAYQNALKDIPGNQLHLYKLSSTNELIRPWKSKRLKYKANYLRLKYEFYDASWRVLIYYTPIEFFNRIREFIRKRFTRR